MQRRWITIAIGAVAIGLWWAIRGVTHAPARLPEVDPAAPAAAPPGEVDAPKPAPTSPADGPDAGTAFATQLCDRQAECGCLIQSPDTCLRSWSTIKADQTASLECLFQIDCQQLCNIDHDPSVRSCFTALMGYVEQRRALAGPPKREHE